MNPSTASRVKRHRDALRQAGLRPVQLWVPDSRHPGFAAECRRQASSVAQADRRDAALQAFMDAALVELDSWTS